MQRVDIKTQILYGFGPTENEAGSRKAWKTKMQI